MTFSYTITTTAGQLLILRSLHLIFMMLWLGLMISRYSSEPQGKTSLRILSLGSALLSGLFGFMLFKQTPSDLHTSWGFSILLGTAISILMMANEMLEFIFRRVQLTATNLIFTAPVVFLMSMAGHMGIQVSPTSSLKQAVLLSLLPVFVIEVVGLLPFGRRLMARPLVIAFLSLLLTAVLYGLIEYLSKTA